MTLVNISYLPLILIELTYPLVIEYLYNLVEKIYDI